MIKAILWDIDGTLLNFPLAENSAIERSFKYFNIHPCTQQMINHYSQINRKYWHMLEAGQIQKPVMMLKRFEEFFALEHIDFHRLEEFNNQYHIFLADTVVFNDDGYNIVKALKKDVKQYAVTNGIYSVQEHKLKKSGLYELFDDVFISDKIGQEKPSSMFFDYVFEHMPGFEKDQVLIVGDSLTSDMQGGNNAAIQCCWYNPAGAENNTDLTIHYQIKDLHQVIQIVKTSL